MEKEAGDRTPVRPSSSVYPETAYQPNCGSNRRSKPKTTPTPTIAGAQFDKTKVERVPGEELLREMRDMIKTMTEQMSSLMGAQRQSRPKWRSPRGPSKSKGEGPKKSPSPTVPRESTCCGKADGRKMEASSLGTPKRTGQVRCYGCGKPGVFRRDCPNCAGNGPKRA